MRRLIAVSALLAAIAATSGCWLGQIHIPDPPAEPTASPTVPPTVPSAPAPLCVGADKTDCYVEPSAGVYRYVCSAPWLPGGITLVDKPADCPTEPVVPVGCEIVPGSDWQLQPRTEAPHSNAVNAAMLAEAEARGYDCAVGGRCVLPIGGEQAFLDAVILRLRAAGLCAGRQVANRDAVAVGSQADNWTYHAVGFGSATVPPTVAWQPSKAEPADHWMVVTAAAACPPVTRIDLAIKEYATRAVDATPKATGLEACNALGFTGRRECPLGVEGSVQRVECETAAGPWTWSLDGVPCAYPSCWPLADNPLQYATPAAGRVTVCAGNSFCASVVLP